MAKAKLEKIATDAPEVSDFIEKHLAHEKTKNALEKSREGVDDLVMNFFNTLGIEQSKRPANFIFETHNGMVQCELKKKASNAKVAEADFTTLAENNIPYNKVQTKNVVWQETFENLIKYGVITPEELFDALVASPLVKRLVENNITSVCELATGESRSIADDTLEGYYAWASKAEKTVEDIAPLMKRISTLSLSVEGK